MNLGIILASGSGKRMGVGKNKVLLDLGGKPIIFYTIKAFEKNPNIHKIFIVAKKSESDVFLKIAKKYKFKKVSGIIAGGKERQESAFNALIYLKDKIGKRQKAVAVFHNGANPFVSQEDINKSIQWAKKIGACVVAHPTRDTIKEVNECGLVVKTLERKKLWNMQTPQAIEFSLAFEAFFQASRDNFLGTDDVSLVERLGKKVKVVEGSLFNFKITTPLDLEIAKLILKNKRYV